MRWEYDNKVCVHKMFKTDKAGVCKKEGEVPLLRFKDTLQAQGYLFSG